MRRCRKELNSFVERNAVIIPGLAQTPVQDPWQNGWARFTLAMSRIKPIN
jgi:hypothetical protein